MNAPLVNEIKCDGGELFHCNLFYGIVLTENIDAGGEIVGGVCHLYAVEIKDFVWSVLNEISLCAKII